jgi:hypothetical protein
MLFGRISTKFWTISTGTVVTSITTTTITVPHSFLLPAQAIPSGASSSLAIEQIQTASETPVTAGDAITKVSSFPNPTTDNVSIHYILKESGKVSVSVYDTFGQPIAQFAPIEQSAGENTLTLDTSTLPRGAYQILVMTANGISKTKVMITR